MVQFIILCHADCQRQREHIVGSTWSDCVPRFVWLYEHHDERILFYHNYMNKYIWIYIYFEFGSLLCVYMVQSALCKLKYVDRFAAFTIFNGGMRFSKQSPNPIPSKHPYRHKQNQVTNFHSLCWNFHVHESDFENRIVGIINGSDLRFVWNA